MTTALAIVDINTIINEEPRVKDVRLGEVLGMSQPLNIRSNINGNKDELASHGSIHEQREVIEAGKGARRSVTAYYLNEAQALLLCMFARTPKAAEVRRQIIEVFMAWRRQHEGRDIVAQPAKLVPVKAHVRRVRDSETLPDNDTIADIRRLRRCGMYSVEQIAAFHNVSAKAVRMLSDECAVDLPAAIADVQKVGLIDDALHSLRLLYDELGRRLSDAEAAFHTGANNQHAIGDWH